MPPPSMLPTHDRLAVAKAFRFIGRHFPLVAVLCALSAGGRFVQTGWYSLSGSMAQVALEILVEGARIMLGLAVVGDGNPFAGVGAIKQLFKVSTEHKESGVANVSGRLSLHWKSYVWDFALYFGIALALNLVIGRVVALPALVDLAHAWGVSESASTVLLLKNISVIPFTIVFQICFIFRILNIRPWGGRRLSEGE